MGDGISPKKNVSFKNKDKLNIDMNKVKELQNRDESAA